MIVASALVTNNAETLINAELINVMMLEGNQCNLHYIAYNRDLVSAFWTTLCNCAT